MADDARYLGAGARLAALPSANLVDSAFRAELRSARFLYEGLSYADLAHVLMLAEQQIIPPEPATALLGALVDLHEAGLSQLAIDPKWGDLYNNRDAELQRRLGAVAGWLHAGRARREALTIGWLLHLRATGAHLLRAQLDFVRAVAGVAEQYADWLMPDFTYLQHAHPTTLGHFLLGFAYPVLRDAERWRGELRFVDRSPAGSASTNGSRLPLSRERMRELLGFAALAVHNRDAMWQSDVPINLMGVLVSLATSFDRLAEELQIWATEEFGYFDIADEHARTSVIMPNKKNPYALAFVRGQARELTGQLVSVIATNQTPSGQIDNRNTAYDLVPRAIESVQGLAVLLADVLSKGRFDRARLEAQAQAGFTFATEATDLLMLNEGVDSRSAHEIVGAAVAQAITGQPFVEALAAAFSATTGRALSQKKSALKAALTARSIVSSRQGVGSCTPASIAQMIAELRHAAAEMETDLEQHSAAAKFPATLREAVGKRIGRAW